MLRPVVNKNVSKGTGIVEVALAVINGGFGPEFGQIDGNAALDGRDPCLDIADVCRGECASHNGGREVKVAARGLGIDSRDVSEILPGDR